MHQGQPLATAVGVEARNVEGAFVQQIGVCRAVVRLVRACGDELVDVLALGVIAVIERHAVVGAQRQGRALAAEAADGGAFLRRGGRVEGVDLHHPAETVRLVDVAAVGLVGLGRRIEALIHRFPRVVIAELAVGKSVALVRNAFGEVVLVAVDEVLVPVLLARKVGTPGRDAHGAVVQGAEYSLGLGVAGGAQQIVASQGAGQVQRRAAGDAAVVARPLDALPLAPGVLLHLDHAQAVGRDFLAHLAFRTPARTIGTILEVWPFGCSVGLMYSWLMTSRPWLSGASGKGK